MSAVLKPPEVSFRLMTEDDLDDVLAIEAGAYSYPWSAGIFGDCLRVGYCCWLVEHQGETTGYGIMAVGAGEAHILNLCIRNDYHGQGLGSALLEHLMAVGLEHHASMVFLEVRPSNENAIRLYQKAGFTTVGKRRAYYPAQDGKEDALILTRQLLEVT